MKKWIDAAFHDRKIWVLLAAGILLLGLCAVPQEKGMTQTEQRIADMLSLSVGAGDVKVTIYYEQSTAAFSGNTQAPVGAVAVCEGAGDIAVRLRLTEALKTLLGLNVSQVMVLEMEER